MQIYECKHKVKCDFAGCKNIADYSVVRSGILRHDLCFCKTCMQELYDTLGKLLVPKAVKSPFKLNKRITSNEK